MPLKRHGRLACFLVVVLLSDLQGLGAASRESGETRMRVQFETEGGIASFPGLTQPVIVDSHGLPPEEAAELKRLVDKARFFDLPTQVGPAPRGAADYHIYTVTIQENGRRHTVRLTDFIREPELKTLLAFLKRLSAGHQP